ncbi:MAG: sensor histidine kinase [Clostridia bacterium]|nr:sensor histidine kinase [Clostridia bacterium]
MWVLWEIAVNVVEGALSFLLMAELAGLPATRNRRITAVVCGLAIISLVSVLNLTIAEGFITVLVVNPIVIAYCCVFSSGALGIRIYAGCMCCVLTAAANQIVSLVMVHAALDTLPFLASPSAGRLFPTLLYLLILALMTAVATRLPKISADIPRNVQVILVCLSIPLCLLSSALQTMIRVTALEPWAQTLYDSFLLATTVFSISFCIALYLLLSFTQRNTAQALELQSTRWELESGKQRLEFTRSWIHDDKQHWAVLNVLAGNNDLQGIRDYLQSLGAELNKVSPQALTGDSTIDAILTAKLAAAEADNIQIICKPGLIRHNPLTDVQTAQLIGNLADNAMKACRAWREENDRVNATIKIRIEEREQMFHVSFCNPWQSSGGDRYQRIGGAQRRFSKRYGLKNIQRIAQQANGYVMTDTGSGIWQTDVWIPMNFGEDKWTA